MAALSRQFPLRDRTLSNSALLEAASIFWPPVVPLLSEHKIGSLKISALRRESASPIVPRASLSQCQH